MKWSMLMLVSEGSAPELQPDGAASEVPPGSMERHDSSIAEAGYHDALALGFTAAIVAFVGAIVVLTIPYALLSAPLPPSVDRLGLSVKTTQGLLFERPWSLLAPAILVAFWTGYSSYRWSRAARAGDIT
jgi:hypothetical protein